MFSGLAVVWKFFCEHWLLFHSFSAWSLYSSRSRMMLLLTGDLLRVSPACRPMVAEVSSSPHPANLTRNWAICQTCCISLHGVQCVLKFEETCQVEDKRRRIRPKNDEQYLNFKSLKSRKPEWCLWPWLIYCSPKLQKWFQWKSSVSGSHSLRRVWQIT